MKAQTLALNIIQKSQKQILDAIRIINKFQGKFITFPLLIATYLESPVFHVLKQQHWPAGTFQGSARSKFINLSSPDYVKMKENA